MSLTRILKTNKKILNLVPNIKEYLKDINGDKINWKTKILIKSIGKSYEAGIIGTAFDYAARALLARKHKEADVKLEETLIAQKGLESFLKYSTKRPPFPYLLDEGKAVFSDKEEGIKLLNINDVPEGLRQQYRGCELIYEMSIEIEKYFTVETSRMIQKRNNYIQGNCDLDTLIKASIFLAELDTMYRAIPKSLPLIDRFFNEKFGTSYFSSLKTVSENEIIENIREMLLNFEQAFLSLKPSSIILNPSFNQYSKIVKADADFLIDDTLFDIKTKNKLSYEIFDFAQLIAYACMGNASGLNINHIAVYYARFGVIAFFNLNLLEEDFYENYLKAIVKR